MSCALNPEHVSCYALKIEEGTPFYDYKEMLNLPDDETQADMYLAAVEALRSRRLPAVRNFQFCPEGLYSRHNMNTGRAANIWASAPAPARTLPESASP